MVAAIRRPNSRAMRPNPCSGALALDLAGVTKDDLDAYWFGTSQSAASGISLATPLRLSGKPVTRVENYCATGSEASSGNRFV